MKKCMPVMSALSRRSVLSGLVCGAVAPVIQGLSTNSVLAASPKKQYNLIPRLVADGIWMVEGATEHFSQENGGAIVNCTLIETSAGVVIVDTGASRKYGEALRALAQQIQPRGIAAVINTHHHPDHFFGNQVFADKKILALKETKTLSEQDSDAFSDNMYRLLGDWMRGTEPTPPNSIIDISVLTIGQRQFTILPLKGHTASDLALLDKKTGTLITGDLAFLDRAPTTPHANIADWKASLRELQAVNASGILPGHGPFDRAERSLTQTYEYLDWLDKSLRDAAKQGFDMVEIQQLALPKIFEGLGAMPHEYYRSVSHLFPDIERELLPLVNR